MKHQHKLIISKLRFNIVEQLEHTVQYNYFPISFTAHFQHVKAKFQASVYIYSKKLDIIWLNFKASMILCSSYAKYH